MKLFLVIVLISSFSIHACPVGMTESTHGFGNSICSDSTQIRTITGSLNNCPNGFDLSQDKWGNTACFDGSIFAYELSNGCPRNLQESWDKYERKTCLNFDNKPVIELLD